MARRSPGRLSDVSVAVLRAIDAYGPLPDAHAAVLRRAAGPDRYIVSALTTLRDRFLVRWDDGGRRIRITAAGQRLLDCYSRL